MFAAALLVALTSASAPPEAPITVTGVRPTPATIHAQAVDFVHSIGVAAGETAAARWIEPVCPHAVGLTDEPARIVETKLRAIATAAGVVVAPPGCAPNIAIVFATDAGDVVRDLVARAPRRLSGVRPAAVKALTEGAAPIRWWYVSEARDKDGGVRSAEAPPALGLAAGSSAPSLPLNEETSFISHYNNSLVSTETIRVLHAATVVVDVTRTDGLPLSAVASYATMVALAEIRPGAAPFGSVLALFAGGPVRRELSAWDTAFLHALYHLPLDRTAQRQRGRLVADLVAAGSP